MANSKISMPEMTLVGYGLRFFQDAKAALAEMPRASRWFHIFWLLGPLILLIERSPADAWLTICALTFVVRAIVRRDSSWLKVFWVRAVFAFWGVCLLSAALSELPAYSLGEAFIWIRFPLFAMASCFWLARDKRLLYAMMGMTMLGMIIMTGILTAEILIVGQQSGRLSWPYGDLVPGNYLAKAGLPAFCVMVTLIFSTNRQISLLALILSLFTLAISAATGERMNFIIRVCSALLAAVIFKPNWKILLLLGGGFCIGPFLLFLLSPYAAHRFLIQFVHHLPLNPESAYMRVWNGAIDAFLTSPVLGIGPDNYRLLCSSITTNSADVDCHTHPHNYYLQIAAETGIIGLIVSTVMVVSIIWACLRLSLRHRDNVVLATAFIVPLGLFFPIQSTADFFGQWNNIFMWSGIALALATSNLAQLTSQCINAINASVKQFLKFRKGRRMKCAFAQQYGQNLFTCLYAPDNL